MVITVWITVVIMVMIMADSDDSIRVVATVTIVCDYSTVNSEKNIILLFY